MSDAAEILVIIISIFLAFFLVIAIVLTIMLIKVMRQIRTVTSSAKGIVDNLNSVTSNVSKMVSPAIIAKVAMAAMKKFKQR